MTFTRFAVCMFTLCLYFAPSTLCRSAQLVPGISSTVDAAMGTLPNGVPVLAHANLVKARGWEWDAELVLIELHNSYNEPGSRPMNNVYSLVFKFYSPNLRGFRDYVVGPGRRSYEKIGKVVRETTPLNLSFVDLPQAVASARAAGKTDQLKYATLHYTRTGPSSTEEAWDFPQIGSRSEKALLVLADSGKALKLDSRCFNCETGPEIAARESNTFGIGAIVPQGELQLEAIDWTWSRDVYQTQGSHIEQGPDGTNRKVWSAPVSHTDYDCYNVVRGPNGYFFLNGHGQGIPQDCTLHQNQRIMVSRNGNAIAVGAYFTRHSNGSQYFEQIGSKWVVKPYDKGECSALGIDVCP